MIAASSRSGLKSFTVFFASRRALIAITFFDVLPES